MLAEDGKPWEKGKKKWQWEWERQLGDDLCEVCPRWDKDALAARPPLDAEGVFFVQLAARCSRFNCLPSAGGILDQDQQVLGIVDDILSSRWWEELNVRRDVQLQDQDERS